jgi:L-fuconolactonase
VADVAVGLLSLSAVARFAAEQQRARITVIRMGGARYRGPVDAPWDTGMAELAVCPNVRLKINGLLNNAPPGDPEGWGPSSVGWRVENYKPWITSALRLFGEGRAMYGSDWPVCMANATWKESMACFTQSMGPRTEAFRESVLGGSAAEWYRLGG